MGAERPLKARRSRSQPSAEPRQAGDDSDPRTGATRDGSQIRATPLAGVLQGFRSQIVEASLGDIMLKLPIPPVGVVLSEPCPQLGQIVIRETGDCRFDLGCPAHVPSVPFPMSRGKIEKLDDQTQRIRPPPTHASKQMWPVSSAARG